MPWTRQHPVERLMLELLQKGFPVDLRRLVQQEQIEPEGERTQE